MVKNKVLVYGASGFMGQLFLKMATGKGFDIVIGSRTSINSSYPIRVFSLDNKATISQHIQDVQLVINLAGPFKNTNKQWVEACIENGTHYIDIAGEVAELETVFAYHEKAKQAGVMLMPAAGFGVVPTDIVANLAAKKLPDATHLTIAYVTEGGASRGTLKTVLSDIHKEGVVMKNGKFEPKTPASARFSFENKGKTHNLVYNPWRADLFSAYHSTGIPNIETYANFPSFVVKMMQGKLLWLRDFMLRWVINLMPVGPSDKQLASGNTLCFAEVKNAKGEKATATIEGPEAYIFTAKTLIAISQKIINNDVKVGFQTPNIYGQELLRGIEGVRIY